MMSQHYAHLALLLLLLAAVTQIDAAAGVDIGPHQGTQQFICSNVSLRWA